MESSEQIEKFQGFVESTYSKDLAEAVEKGHRCLNLDFQELMRYDVELAEALLNSPEDLIQAAEIAISQFDFVKSNIRARFKNLPESQYVAVRDIRSKHLSKFISIEGIVRQASDVRPQVVTAKFECPSCGNTISVLQLDSRFKEPFRCSCGRKGKFKLLSKDLVDAQRLVVEEAPENLEGGEQPKRLSVFLKEDLVEPKMEKKTTPGSKILVMGVVKEVPIILSTGALSTRYDLAMDANFIEPIHEDFSEVNLSPEDIVRIKEMAADPKVIENLVGAIAPSIYGHEKVKEAITLLLFGGVKKTRPDRTSVRGDIHILLVGDPGAAKSSMLTFVAKAAPKARYIAGRSASGAGITASVVKDEFMRGWALEAGAMVLANKGILCLDEMDKMSDEDTSALHEAMAQQQISISKANIQATLRAETTVLAAANPKLGRFDPFAPIASQISLPPALINRFDLIFPIRDLPNKEVDERIAQHVLNIHQDATTMNITVDTQTLRKYIAYTKQHINPRLSDGAIDEIKSFYVALRNSGSSSERDIKPIPISARQLESLVRMAEAAARIRLSDSVTRADAKRAVELLKHCLLQVGVDPETGQIDIDRISTGMSSSQRGKIISVREIINDLESKYGKTIPIEDVMSEAAERGLTADKIEEAIEKLKRSGDLYEPKKGFLAKI